MFLNADTLVSIVHLLATAANPVVTGEDIMAWCNANAVDYGAAATPLNGCFWDADLAEARRQHRLQKFKQGRQQNAPVGWALVETCAEAKTWARHNGWLVVPWVCDNWDWANSYPP